MAFLYQIRISGYYFFFALGIRMKYVAQQKLVGGGAEGCLSYM